MMKPCRFILCTMTVSAVAFAASPAGADTFIRHTALYYCAKEHGSDKEARKACMVKAHHDRRSKKRSFGKNETGPPAPVTPPVEY